MFYQYQLATRTALDSEGRPLLSSLLATFRFRKGYINLTYLTTAIQVSGVLFVGLLPEYKEDLERLKASKLGTSKIGGFIFLFITLASIAYAILVGLLNICFPGWMGES